MKEMSSCPNLASVIWKQVNKLTCLALHLFITGVSVCSLRFSWMHVTSLFLFDSLNGWCFSWVIFFCKIKQSNLWLEQHSCGLMNITYRRRRKRDLCSIDLLIWSDLPAFSVTLLKVDFFVSSWAKNLQLHKKWSQLCSRAFDVVSHKNF